jgi:sigma-B regulation protein RsbU (phosphoserine phosphatase)
VNSILREDYLRPAPEGYEYVAWAVLALALGFLLPALAPEVLGLVALGGLLSCVILAWTLLVFTGIQMTVVPPMFIILSLSIGVLLRGYVLRDRERHAAEQELEVARRVQQGLLPTGPLQARDVQVSGLNLPCFAVGGDYFDYFPLGDGRIAIAIGDVAGKGVPAALLMSKLQAILRGECAHEFTVPEVPERANRLLMESSQGSTKFITFFFATLDPKTHELRYTNAGHNPPVLLRRDGTVELLDAGGLLLGIFPLATYDEGMTELRPGDVLFLFTDGVTEAEDRRKAQYGDERLLEVLRSVRGGTAREIGERVCDSVVRFSYGLHMADDLTVVAVKVTEEAAPAAEAGFAAAASA